MDRSPPGLPCNCTQDKSINYLWNRNIVVEEELKVIWKCLAGLLLILLVLCLVLASMLSTNRSQERQLLYLQQKLDDVAGEHSIVVERGYTDEGNQEGSD